MTRVFITGASSGIGLALAREYAARGATLGLLARRADVLKQLAAELPGKHFTYAVDVVDTIDTFVEIEYVQSADDPNAEAKLFAEAQRLGIDPATQFEPKNYGLLVWEEAHP